MSQKQIKTQMKRVPPHKRKSQQRKEISLMMKTKRRKKKSAQILPKVKMRRLKPCRKW
jgi:hypothetical protein